MKKILLSGLVALAACTATAQEGSDPFKSYHNEFGVDATGFLRQFFNIDQMSGSNYYPNYYITYRRKFSAGNIRFAIGGAFSNSDVPPVYPGDLNKYKQKNISFDARIGWEFKTDLSRRWQVFYGADFKPSYYHQQDDAPYWNGGYANGRDSKMENYGVAPVLGFRFRLTNRLSILTETSLSLNFQSITDRSYYISPFPQTPAPPDEIRKQKRVYTSYNQPLSVFITFDI